jgi:hypothetical protein
LENRHSTFNNKLMAYVNTRRSMEYSLARKIAKMARELFTGFSMRGRKRIGFTLDATVGRVVEGERKPLPLHGISSRELA